MNLYRKFLSMVLVLIFLAGLSLPVSALPGPDAGEQLPAAEEADPPGEDAGDSGAGPAGPEAGTEPVLPEGSGVPADEAEPLLDAEELEDLIGTFREERGLTEENFSVAYCYTGTGETWSWNGDRFFPGASLYKLSLMMGLARKVSSGELRQEDEIYGMDISYIEKMSLT